MDVTKLLKDLAIGIIHYEIQSQKSTLPPLPLLPQPLQISWNQLTMECIKKGICPPKNLQEFVAWLTTPIEEWEYFGEKWSELGWRGCLVEDLAPTELSYDLSQGAHEAPELEEKPVDLLPEYLSGYPMFKEEQLQKLTVIASSRLPSFSLHTSWKQQGVSL
ncbi:hypothetical protein [Laceyella tengchongensis]|uniref:pPIWI_RE_Y domain-containing protein n=1 Tax=Laceyella tengchongensis TaxID=574699 RepID=UPI0012B8F19B|nr:hypothetical protein [Laceyella tengchongensis]